MYKKVTSDMNFIPREEEVLKFWKENEIFKKSQAAAEGKPEWTFYDGPPTANGKPHIGHILTRCIKDLFPRYKSMKGYNVLRKAGWDTHGLPVELEVEKQLGLDGKEQIEEYSQFWARTKDEKVSGFHMNEPIACCSRMFDCRHPLTDFF